MRGLGFLSRRWLVQHKGRTVLTGTGIALGVAFLFATLIVSASSTRGFEQLMGDMTGAADVIVSPVGTFGFTPLGGSTMSGDVRSRVEGLPGVAATAEALAFTTVIQSRQEMTGFEANQPPAVVALGVDFEAIRDIYELELSDGRLPASHSQTLVASRIARELDVIPGSEVVLSTPTGDREVRITGILSESGAGLLNQGGVVFLPIEAARGVSGAGPDAASMVLVRLEDGVDAGGWAEDADVELGSSASVQALDEAWDLAHRQVAGLTGLYTVSATAIVFVAGFLVYLTLSMAVVERTRLYGTLFALGGRRRQIRWLVIRETLVLSSVATGVGLLVGFGLSHILLSLTGRLTNMVGPELIVRPGAVGAAAGFGVVVSLASALVPAHRAARIDPVEAMRGDYGAKASVSRAWVAGVLAIAAVVVLASGGIGGGVLRVALTMPLVLFGAVLILPPLLRPMARILGKLTARLARGVGEVAVYHLSLERTRSAYTLGLIMVVVALTVSMTATRASFTQSMDRQLDRSYGADFTLRAASTFDDQFARALADVPGVRSVAPQALGASRIVHDDDEEAVVLWVVDPAEHFAVMELNLTQQEEEATKRALGAGGSVILAEATAERLGLGVDDGIVLRTIEGPQPFKIAGLTQIANAPPTLVVGFVDAPLFGLGRPTALHVLLERGADASSVRNAVVTALGPRTTFLVETTSDIKADVRAQLGAGFNGMLVLVLLAGVVGLAGLANTLTMSVFERHREIGLLRAIGVRSRQLVGMTLVESSTLVLVALVLGIPLGVILSFRQAPILASVIGDFSLSYVFPWLVIPVVAVMTAVVAMVASIGPARRAASIEIEEALRVE